MMVRVCTKIAACLHHVNLRNLAASHQYFLMPKNATSFTYYSTNDAPVTYDVSNFDV